jgi:hypothetical protein
VAPKSLEISAYSQKRHEYFPHILAYLPHYSFPIYVTPQPPGVEKLIYKQNSISPFFGHQMEPSFPYTMALILVADEPSPDYY